MERIIRKSYKFRLYPSKSQVLILETTLDLCRELYNAALQERRDAWKLNKKSISFSSQCSQLPEIKRVREDLSSVYSQVLQDVLQRLDKTFQAFFKRVKRSENTGYPRFKGKNRFESFCYPQNANKAFYLNGNKLTLSKIGKIKIKISRPIIGKIKTLTVKKECDKWFAFFVVETTIEPLPKTEKQIGIDVGIENFATLSDGTQIENYRFYESAQKELRKAQKCVSRKKKGSNSRQNAVLKLRKIYGKIKNRRVDFQHKLSTSLVQNFDVICVEKLNILGLSKGILSKQIHDVSWGSFFQMLRYKAENADKRLIEVNPNGTSQTCLCGNVEKKSLSQRQHKCLKCGYENHRDIVSAQIILSLGLRDLNVTKAVGL